MDSADRQIRKLSRRIDKYERMLAKADRQQGKLGKGLDGLENRFKSAKGKVDKFAAVLGGAGLVSAAVGAVQALDELIQSTTKYQNVMRNLPFSVDKAKSATLGLVDSYDLAKAAIQAHRLGVVSSEEDFARLAEAGAKLSLSIGEDASKGVEDLTTALARGSAPVLDNLGITLKVADAQREYAQRLGVSVDALSAAQKAEAFREIGLERALVSAAKTNIVVDEGAQKWNETKQQAMDFAREVLPKLLDVLELLFDAFETYIGWHESLYGAVDTVINETMRFLELGAIYDEQITNVRGLTGAYKDLGLAAQMVNLVEDTAKKSAERKAETAELLRAEKVRHEQEATFARIAQAQTENVGAIDKEITLRKAQGAHEAEINGLIEHRALLQTDYLEQQGKGVEAEATRWQERLRAEQDRTAKRKKWAEQAKATRAAEEAAAVSALERRAELEGANGRQAWQIELQLLELKRAQAEASTPRNGAERVQLAERLLELETQRQIKLIEIETKLRDEDKVARRREVEELGQLELGRLEHRAELLTTNAELEAESWTTRLTIIEAEREATLAQLDLRHELLELEYGEEVYTNKAALAELEQVEHDQKLARLDAQVRKREWAADREAALAAERQARHKKIADIIGKTESASQTAMQGTAQLYDLVAQAQGVSAETRKKVAAKLAGGEMMITGAVETGKAIAAYASFNFVQGALHTASAAFNFAKGGMLLSGRVPTGGEGGGGSSSSAASSSASSSHDTSAAASLPESVPSASPSSEPPPAGSHGSSGGQGGGATVNVHVSALGSVDEEAVARFGREVSQAALFTGDEG